MKGIEGSTLGRYELHRRVAQGGISEVYLGYDRRVRRRVAIKVLYGSDEPFVRRFEREALAVGTLSHDHILPLYDFGEQRPWYYLVMPYIDGGTLRDYLCKRERLTLEEAGSILEQIASALQHAHDHGVVHRDVKPSNILLRPDGHAYLADFGLAKAKMEADSPAHTGGMVGTPEYMAPEQSNGLNDYRSDIYSLGIILYQMLTGQVPFTGESPVVISIKHMLIPPIRPSQLNSEIPQAIEDVILKALAKDPDERYQEARALSTAYRKALQMEAISKQSDALPPVATEELDESTENIQEAVSIPANVTQVLSPFEQALVSTQKTPLLFPLENEIPPLPSPQGIPRQRRYRHLLLLAILCFALLISSILLSVVWQDQPSQQRPVQSLTATATQRWATGTAIAQAGIQATLAAQARAQATAGITSAIGAGSSLYNNTMASAGGGWIDDGTQCRFATQGYHVYSGLTHSVAWCYSNQPRITDAVITVQAQLLRGDIYGLVFRLHPQSKTFYVLEINNRGQYRLVRAQGSNPLNWLTLIDWTSSNAIQSGYRHINTFLVIARGSHFRFYINKQLIVSTFTDSAYTSGLIGFLAGGDSREGTEAIFSNLWVFQK